MLNRNVEINGVVWNTHTVVSATFIPLTEIIVTVKSSLSSDVEIDNSIETSYSISWNNLLDVDFENLDILMQTLENIVWGLPEFEEYVDMNASLNTVLDILTDEQAQQVVGLYPAWVPNMAYTVGDRVKHNDILYRCVQAHTSQTDWEPDKTPALWASTAPDNVIPDWVQPIGSQDAYMLGDKVRHKGSIWKSTLAGNVWEPGVYGWDIVN